MGTGACGTGGSEAGISLVGDLLVILLTVLFVGAAVYYVLYVNVPEKAPITGFDVAPQNATTLRIISLAGSPIPADGVRITIGNTQFSLAGLKDVNGNRDWDPGEIAMIGAADLTRPVRVVIAYKTYLLLDTTVKFTGPAANSSSVPAFSPGLIATYYGDEVWSSPAATRIAPEIRYADDAGAGIGYLSDESQWPVAEVGRDDQFSVKFAGLLKIDAEADYTFYLTSDDGSYLAINGTQYIDNGGLHSATERSATVHLAPGYQPISVRMSEHTGQAVVRLEYSAPGVPRAFVTALYHLPEAPPIADFSATPTVANAPATVQFQDRSTDATAWAWDFGDGNSSTLQNPAHTYSADGKYDVRLIATNPLGSGSMARHEYIQLGSAVPGFTATYYRDEAWGTRTAVRTIGRIRFADQAGAGIGHLSDESQWPVAEVGRDDQFSVTFDGVLKIDAEADYTFYLTSDDGAYLAIDGAQVIDNGGLHSATEKAGVRHLSPGYHAVEVRMFEHTGEAVVGLEYSAPGLPRAYVSAVFHAAVTPPVVDFVASPLAAGPPATVQFTDRSLDATAWAWDFGDGNTSAQQNPIHTYTSSGNYTVRLTASNVIGNETATKPEYVRIGALRAGFNATYYSDETWGTAVKTELAPQIRLADSAGVAAGYASDLPAWPVAEAGRDDQFSVKFAGSLKIDAEADYTFYLTSDDGSYLAIDGAQVIDNGGLHSPATRSGTVHLTAGYHAVEVRMFEHTGQAVVRLEYSSPTMPRKFVQEAYSL